MTPSQTSRRFLPAGAIAALAAFLATVGIGISGAVAAPETERVIAGTVADPADWPFIGALYITPKDAGGKEFLDCGATVIAPRAALTAAHCVAGERAKRFSLVVGRPNLADRSAGQEIPIRSTVVNPDYARRPTADVAILVLSRDAGVPAATIPSVAQSDAATKAGALLRVAGWGGTRPSGARPSKPLLTTGETVLEGTPCRRAYGNGFSNRTTICTQGAKLPPPQGGHAGACYGDSGGPLIADTLAGPLLVGAVSGGGLRCGTSADYYARISANLAFIEKAAGVAPVAP